MINESDGELSLLPEDMLAAGGLSRAGLEPSIYQ